MLTGDNGIITKANIAKISTDFAGYKEELESWKTAKKMEDTNFSEDTLFAGKNNLSYNSNKREGNIKNIIPDLKDSAFRYQSKLCKATLTIDSNNPNYMVEGNLILTNEKISENAISGAPWGVPKGARIVSWN